MDDEKFKLNDLNIILIVIDVIIFFLIIVAAIFLSNSLKEEVILPDLEVTEDRTSTKVSRTKETITTTTTTTKKNLVSPYYELNVNEILSDEIYTKRDLTKEEALEVITNLYKIASQMFNITDNTLVDSSTVIEYAKEGEIDKVILNDHQYAIIYNGDELIKKVFNMNYLYGIQNHRIKDLPVIKKEKGNYYRLENVLSNVELVVLDEGLKSYSGNTIEYYITYYKSNYKEDGFTAPNYKRFNFTAIYENKRWVLSEFDYPLFD